MKIIAMKVFQLKQLKRRNLKKFRLEWESNPFLHLRNKYELTIDQLPVGLIAQLVRALRRYHRGHGFDSRSSLNFFRFLLFNRVLKLKYLHCDELHIILSLPAVLIYDYFIYSYSFLHLRDKYELTIDQLPVGVIAQLVRALHRYRRGHGLTPVQA